MDFIFADDSRQQRPTRLGVGPLIGIGGVHVPGDAVGALERAIDDLCQRTGFPEGEQFKWSPGKQETFMRKLEGERRFEFLRTLLTLALAHDVTACVVIEDQKCRPARETSADHEHDATALFLERVDTALQLRNTDGVVIVAEPSGGYKEEARFAARCAELRQLGTEYSGLTRLPLGVFVAGSRQLRLLQLADVVTSCVMARVSGEIRYSEELFGDVKPLLQQDNGRIGGIGVKIHPDFKYGNLYHWLLGDSYIMRHGLQIPLPERGGAYEETPQEPVVVKGMLAAARMAVRAMKDRTRR